MINWDGLESDIEAWFADLSEKTEDDTAKFLADSYAQTVAAATDPKMNAVVPPGKEASIESAWSTSFKAQKASADKMGAPNWLAVEANILLYWTGAMFATGIVHGGHHPGTGISNVVAAPGSPGIAAAIDKAFKQEDAALVAKELVAGYKDHASTIAGIMTALIPPTASSPLPVPWTGIK